MDTQKESKMAKGAENIAVVKAGVRASREYCKWFLEQYPQYDKIEFVELHFIIGTIFFTGFSEGYDHSQKLTKEILSTN